jgi:lysozyme
MNLKGKLIALAILSIIVLFGWLMMQDKSGKSYLYADFGADLPEDYQALGIDVSHYQGDISWKEVSAMKIHEDSIHFVYLKCTEGTALEDDRCTENAEGASAENLVFGLYHFFRAELSAYDQAVFFAEKCLALNDSLRPALDVEIRNNFSKDRLVDSAYVFLQTVEKLVGVRPMIYTNESFYEDYFVNSYLKNERYWIANYNRECESMDHKNVLIWQFSETGTVNGIKDKVDLNVAKPEFWDEVYLP